MLGLYKVLVQNVLLKWHTQLTHILKQGMLDGSLLNTTVRVKSVECFEHGANSAT